VGRTVSLDSKLTHADPVVLGQTMSYATILAALINGEPFDEHMGTRWGAAAAGLSVLPYATTGWMCSRCWCV
jgi:hypothetical protein